MKHIRKQISKITDELEAFCFSVGAKDITINIKQYEEEFTVTLHSDYEAQFKRKVDKLHQLLNPEDKNIGFAGTYWELLGESDPDYEIQLNLVGQLISFATVEVDDNGFEVVVHKKREH